LRISALEYRSYELCRRYVYMRIQMQLFLPVAFLKQLIIYQSIKTLLCKSKREIKSYNCHLKLRNCVIKHFLWFEREYTYKYLSTYRMFYTRDDFEIRAFFAGIFFDRFRVDYSLFFILLILHSFFDSPCISS